MNSFCYSCRRPVTALALMLTMNTTLEARDTDTVAISSTAAPTYQRPRDAQGRLQPESYLFFQGHFIGGWIHSRPS
jgi:hypothetical protein